MTDITMDIDDLKLAWQTLDRRLERQHALALHQYKEGAMRKARSRLRPLRWGQLLQMPVGALLILAAVAVWARQWDVVHLRVAGLILHAYGVLLIVSGGRTLSLLNRLDNAAPVVVIQRQLADLRRWYVLSGLAIGHSWWLLWMPFMMVLAALLTGVDIYARAPAVFSRGAAIGVAGLVLTWALYRWSRHPRWARFARGMDDAMTGESLRRAQAVLDEIRQFEEEDADRGPLSPTA